MKIKDIIFNSISELTANPIDETSTIYRILDLVELEVKKQKNRIKRN